MQTNDNSQPLNDLVGLVNIADNYDALDKEITTFLQESGDIDCYSVPGLDLRSEVLLGSTQPHAPSKRDYRAAQHEIKSLKLANQGLRESLPENRQLTDEQRTEQNLKLSSILRQFQQIEKIYPKWIKLEEQLIDINIQLNKNKDAHKNKVSLVELEAFKLATRTEFTALIDFKLDQQKQHFTEQLQKIENRQKQIGKQCEDIIPMSLFKDYNRRQQGIELQIEHITSKLLPAQITASQTILSGKVDRHDVEQLIMKYLNTAMSKINFNGASLAPLTQRPPTPKETVTKQKKVQAESTSSEEEIKKKKKKSKKVRESSSSSSHSEKIKRRPHHSKTDKHAHDDKHNHGTKTQIAFGSHVTEKEKSELKTREVHHTHTPPRVSVVLDESSDKHKPTRRVVSPIATQINSHVKRGSSVSSQSSVTHQLNKIESERSQEHKRKAHHSHNQQHHHHDKAGHHGHHDHHDASHKHHQASVEKLNPHAHFLEPTISSKQKAKLHHVVSSVESSNSSQRQANVSKNKLLKIVNNIKSELKEQHNSVATLSEKLAHFQRIHDKENSRIHELDQKNFDIETKLHKVSQITNKFEHVVPEIDTLTQQLNERLRVLEQINLDEQNVLSSAPMDPNKRQKYLERRLVLSERNILKLNQELNLYRVEKKSQVDDLVKQVDSLNQFKYDTLQKSDFLYQKITETSKILIDQIEGLTSQLATVKQNVNSKMQNFLKESQLYQVELTRTQQINRELLQTREALTEKQKLRGQISQTTQEMGLTQSKFKEDKTQDSLANDSVMSSTHNEDEKRWAEPPITQKTTGRFWQSVDRKPSMLTKPYTARIVPPLLVGDLQKYSKVQNTTGPKNTESHMMMEDSIHSQDYQSPPTTLQSTRVKIQNLISQNLSIRSQKSHRTVDTDMFLKKSHPIQKIELQKFQQQYR